MLIRDYLAGNARSRPQHLAYVSDTTRLSWGAVADRSWRLAAALQGLGVGKGDVVGILGGDTHRTAEVWFAANAIGAVRTGVNFRYPAAAMSHILNDADVKVLVVQDAYEPVVRSILQDVGGLRSVIGFGDHGFELDYEELVAAHDPDPAWPALDPSDPVAISYTSGSTGPPKGALWRHGAVVEALVNTFFQAGFRHDDVYLHCLPAAGVPVLLATWNVVNGSTIVLQERFGPREALELIEAESVSCTLWVPTMISDVLADPELGRFDLSTLRLVAYGSAPATPTLVRRAMEAFGCELQQWYGSTEGVGGWFTLLQHEDHLRALREDSALLTSCGRPTLHCEVAILGEDDAELERGEVGEICVRGATQMDSYLHLPEMTEQVLRDGWLHTGDLGRLDDEGYVYLVDRKQFMIICGGYNVYPASVENLLAEHPAVREVCVVGVPDERLGEVVGAMVVADGSPSAEDLVAFCSGRLARFEVPRHVTLVDALPRGATGKVQKRDVARAMAAAVG